MAKRAQPYSLVLRGARKEAARTKYLAFLSGTADRPSRIGLGEPRSERLPVVVKPFSLNLPDTVLHVASATIDALRELQVYPELVKRADLADAAPAGSGLTIGAAAATVITVPISGIEAARIIKRVWTTSTATVKTSEITGLKYGYRKSKSYSVPFGRNLATATAGDTISAAFAQLKTEINTANGLTKAFLKDEIA